MAPKDYISSNFVLTWTYIRSYKQKKKKKDELASAVFVLT